MKWTIRVYREKTNIKEEKSVLWIWLINLYKFSNFMISIIN